MDVNETRVFETETIILETGLETGLETNISLEAVILKML